MWSTGWVKKVTPFLVFYLQMLKLFKQFYFISSFILLVILLHGALVQYTFLNSVIVCFISLRHQPAAY